MNKKKMLFKASFLIMIVTILLVVDSYLQAYYPRIVLNEIKVDDLPKSVEDLKIVFLSDVHYGPDRDEKWLKMIVNMINAQDPDLVLLGGDYVEYHASYVNPVMQELANIDAPLGVYAVMGNHDYFRGADLMPQAMERNGIHLIDNKSIWIQLGESGFWIGGVADPVYGEPDYLAASKEVMEEDFFILLSHTPDLIPQLADTKPDVVFSGHTHGGQITLFGKWVPYVPSIYGTKYLSGLFDVRGMKLLVSNGAGTFSKPFRWFAPAQIHRIQLLPKK
jgi:predicted MPP superfamily phosphohydrolase